MPATVTFTVFIVEPIQSAGGISAAAVCEALLKRGILMRETRSTVVRLVPPLLIEKARIDAVVDALGQVLDA